MRSALRLPMTAKYPKCQLPLECCPLLAGEVVDDEIQPALALAGSPRPAASIARHLKSVWAGTPTSVRKLPQNGGVSPAGTLATVR